MSFIKRVANYLITSEKMNRPIFLRKHKKTKKEAAEMFLFRKKSRTFASPPTCAIINNSRTTNHSQGMIQDEEVHHDDTISCDSFSNNDISASDVMKKAIANESGYLDEKATTVLGDIPRTDIDIPLNDVNSTKISTLGDEDIDIPLNDVNSNTISTFSGRRRCNGSFYNKEFKSTLSDYKQDLLMDYELEASLKKPRQSSRSPNTI